MGVVPSSPCTDTVPQDGCGQPQSQGEREGSLERPGKEEELGSFISELMVPGLFQSW